jgi:membrane-associated phospholipid phosphatase
VPVRASRFFSGHRAVVAAAFVVLGLAAALAHGSLLVLDQPTSEWFRRGSHTGVQLEISKLGSAGFAVVVGVVTSLALWRRCRTWALAVPIALLAGAGANVVLKTLIARPRPPAPDTITSLASFPSGHAFSSTTAVGVLVLLAWAFSSRRWVRTGATVVGAVAVVAVAVSRVYLGAHWPTDVIGGVLIGIVLLAATRAVVDHRHEHHGCSCTGDGGRSWGPP